MAHHVIHNQPEYHITSSPPPIFCPMIDARRMEVYTMIVAEDGSILKPINAIVVDETFMEKELLKQQVVFFGNGAAKCSKIIQSPNAQFINEIKASAKYMTDLIWQSYINNRFEDVAYFEPFYLKDFVATVPKRIFPL
jgi:tRNA threonylcarbamoyladenosine biosynthesis protein TsaB